MNIHEIDSLNKIKVTFKTIDLAGRVPGTESIEFLRVENLIGRDIDLVPS